MNRINSSMQERRHYRLYRIGADGSMHPATVEDATQLTAKLPSDALSLMPPAVSCCGNCGTFESPLWRPGPPCKRTLCNACHTRGVRSLLLVHCATCDRYHGDMGRKGKPVRKLRGKYRKKTIDTNAPQTVDTNA